MSQSTTGTPVILAGAEQAAILHPGDLLIVSYNRPQTREYFQYICDAFRDQIPDVRVLVLDGAQISVVRKEDV